MTQTDGPTPAEAVRDLGLELDDEAAALATRVLSLAKVHEKAVTRAQDHSRPGAANPPPKDEHPQ